MKTKITIHRPPLWFIMLGGLLCFFTISTSNQILEQGFFKYLGYFVAGGFFVLVLIQSVIWIWFFLKFIGEDKE